MTARKNTAALVRHKHNEAAEKQCSRCRQWFERKQFYRSARAKDGLQSACKSCDDARSGTRMESNGSRPGAEKPSRKICSLCCNQSWCVDGPECRRCGLKFAPEPRPEMVLRKFG